MKAGKLFDVLKKLEPGLDSKGLTEKGNHFFFVSDEVFTYNDFVTASQIIDDLDIEGSVAGKPLLNFLKKVKVDEDIKVETDGNSLILKAGKFKAEFTLSEITDVNRIDFPDDDEWKEIPEKFEKGMHLCKHSCSFDMSIPGLSCVMVNGNQIVGCSNFQITIFNMADDVDFDKTLIPQTSVNHLRDLEYYAVSDSWIHFEDSDGVILSLRKIEADYPDFSGILNLENPRKIKFPKSISDALDRAGVFIENNLKEEKIIDIKIDKGILEVYSSSDIGKFSEKTELEDDSASDMKLSINPVYFEHSLGMSMDAEITDDVLKIEGDDWEHAIALS